MKIKIKYLRISVVIVVLIIVLSIFKFIAYWQTPLSMEELKQKAKDDVISDIVCSIKVKKPDSLLNFYIGPILRSNDSILYNFEFYRIFPFGDTSKIYVTVDRKRFDFSEPVVRKDFQFNFNKRPEGNINQILPEQFKNDSAFISKLHFSKMQVSIFDSLGFKNCESEFYRLLFFLKEGYFYPLETCNHSKIIKYIPYFTLNDSWEKYPDYTAVKFGVPIALMLRLPDNGQKLYRDWWAKIIVDDSANVLILPL